MKNILTIIVVAIVLWALWGNSSNAITPTGTGDCLADIRVQYGPKWADMSHVERLTIALRASDCAERRQR